MYYRPRRIPADMRASVTLAGRTVPVQVLDVSETGLKLRLSGSYAPHTPLTFHALRQDLSGHLQWCDGTAAGVALDRSLSPGEVGELAGLAWVA